MLTFYLFSGPHETIRALLDASAPEAVLHALSAHTLTDYPSSESIPPSTALRAALARAFRSIITAAAGIAGPRGESTGLGPFPLKGDTVVLAKRVLEHVFQVYLILS